MSKYTIVVWIHSCPSRYDICAIFMPFSSQCEALACRNWWACRFKGTSLHVFSLLRHTASIVYSHSRQTLVRKSPAFGIKQKGIRIIGIRMAFRKVLFYVLYRFGQKWYRTLFLPFPITIIRGFGLSVKILPIFKERSSLIRTAVEYKVSIRV